MYYEAHGEGPPLLLLHGGSESIPEKWIPFFSPEFQVIAMEQMGHGRTADVMDRSFHYHDMAEDTVELMRQLEIESAAVVGYSDGGIIGLDMAIHHPERVTKLAVTGRNPGSTATRRRTRSGLARSILQPSRCPKRMAACLPTAPATDPHSSDV